MTAVSPTILLSAGEASGDLHGAAVARVLRRRWPEARLFGLGGPRMAEAGVELLADVKDLAVMGFAEVAGRLPYFMALFRRVRRQILERGANLIIPIDYPGFNLRLSRAARQLGVPVLYYIAPQVWAWHRSRIHDMARTTDRLAVILPFEEALFREAGARATFVGHPLLDDGRDPRPRGSFCEEFGLNERRPILALFPGSRMQEVRRHLRVFVDAAARVAEVQPAVQPVIAAAETVGDEAYRDTSLPVVRQSRELLAHARAALVKSGTTTLEAALAGVPIVIAYRTHPVTFWLAKRLVQVDHIGLANLVAARRVAPEFVQDRADAATLASAVLPLLGDGPERQAVIEGFGQVRAALMVGREGAGSVAERVAALAAELLEPTA